MIDALKRFSPCVLAVYQDGVVHDDPERPLTVYQDWMVQDNPERPLTVVDSGGTVQDYPERPFTMYQYWRVQINPVRPLPVNQGDMVQDDPELTSTGGPKQDISTWRSSSRCLYLGSPELSNISSWQIIY